MKYNVVRKFDDAEYEMSIDDFVFLANDSDICPPKEGMLFVSVPAIRTDTLLVCYSRLNKELVEYNIQTYSVVESLGVGEYITVYNDEYGIEEECLIVDVQTLNFTDIELLMVKETFIEHSLKIS